MLTQDYDYNLYFPDETEAHLIAYEWRMYPVTPDEAHIYPPGTKWTAGKSYDKEYVLSIPIEGNIKTVKWLLDLFEDGKCEWFKDTLKGWKTRTSNEDGFFAEYDSWGGYHWELASKKAPAVVREFVTSLPEYEDGQMEDVA